MDGSLSPDFDMGSCPNSVSARLATLQVDVALNLELLVVRSRGPRLCFIASALECLMAGLAAVVTDP